MLPQSNAILTKVERRTGTADPDSGGFTEDYDLPATDPEGDVDGGGDDVWTGTVRCYFTERRRRITTGSGSNVILERSVLIDPVRPDLEFRQDDTLTVEHDGQVKTGKAQVVEARRMRGVKGPTRITLEDE